MQNKGAHWTSTTGNTFLYCYESDHETQIHREARLISSFVLLSAAVFNLNSRSRKMRKSHVSTGPDGFFWTGLRQPIRPYTGQLSLWFPLTLCARGYTGHLIKV